MDYKIRIVRYLYFFSFVGLLILYLFPGSLIGYLFYGDFSRQPDIIPNPLGTSINHTIAFFYLSILGLISYMRGTSFKQTLIFLVVVSLILELSHLIIPNRSFEIGDLLANFFGVIFVAFYFILKKRK